MVPSEDEWYKAAFYDPAKSGEMRYWDYPTRSNLVPSNVFDPNGTNNANYHDEDGTGNGGYTIGAPYYRTEVGTFTNSPSAYGTFDQGGNVWEWTEASFHSGSFRGIRGGGYYNSGSLLFAAVRPMYEPTSAASDSGFRLVYIPEPATIMLVFVSLFVGLRRRAL